MNIEIFKAMVLNIGLLILLAQLFAGIKVVRRSIVYENGSIKDQLFLIVIFSIMAVISNYTGYKVNGAIANTRVIGVMGSGFIGGPIVALGVSLIASIHRFLMDPNGFSTIACTISTLLAGAVVIGVSKDVKENKFKGSQLFITTFIVESLQMLIILMIARPYDEALFLVKNIFWPMTIFNSAGIVLFVGIFKNLIREQEEKIGRKVNLTFDIAKKSLPIIQKGEYNTEACDEIGEIILDFSNDLGVVFTDTEKIISLKGDISLLKKEEVSMPEIAKRVFKEKKTILVEDSDYEDIFHEQFKKMVAIGTPLLKNNEIFGSMIIFSRKYRISYESQVLFSNGLSELLSTQYELSDMEKQKELLIKAEYKALQSQINPHFIFNSLNTISSFIREKPSDARELLIALSTYFRNSIKRKDALVSIYEEMEYVDAFLQLVKARFDERLKVVLNIQEGLDYMVPCLIVQPIVENAVIHGAMSRKEGRIKISIEEIDRVMKISIEDNGYGIPDDIIKGLEDNNIDDNNIGLANVDKRLRYIYGKDNGLNIVSRPFGTRVDIQIKRNKLIKMAS